MDLEAKFNKFVTAFRLDPQFTYPQFLVYCSSGMRCRARSEEHLVEQIKRDAPADRQRAVYQVLLRIIGYPVRNRLFFLYAVCEMNRERGFSVQVYYAAAYDPPAPRPVLGVSALNGSNNSQISQGSSARAPAGFCIPQERVPTKTLLKHLIYALQGKPTDVVGLEISKLTGLYHVVCDTLSPTQQALLGEISDCCGLYKRIEQIAQAFESTRSKMKMAFLEYLHEYISGEYLGVLTELRAVDEFPPFLQIVRAKIRPFLIALAQIAERFAQAYRDCQDYLEIAYYPWGVDTSALIAKLTRPITHFLLYFAHFGEVADTSSDFFFSAYQDNANPFFAFKNTSQNPLCAHYYNIGLNVHFLRRVCANADFKMTDSPEFYELLTAQDAGSLTMAQLEREADPLLAYVSRAVASELESRHLDVYLRMVLQIFLGFQSDFLTAFAESQIATSPLQDMYMLSAVNQLAHLVDSSKLALFPKEFLEQVFPVVQQGQIRLNVQLKPLSPFNCIFLTSHIECLSQTFIVVLILRMCEILAAEKRGQARLQASMFKILNLLRVLACYLHGQFQSAIQDLNREFTAEEPAKDKNNHQNRYEGHIERLYQAMNTFCAQLKKITLDGRLLPLLEAIYQILRSTGQLKSLSKKVLVIKQIRDYDDYMDKRCRELAGELVGVQNGLEDEYELLTGQLQACGFRRV